MRTLPTPIPLAGTIPRLFPDSTIVCIASGPSLTKADVDFCRNRARVIVVNDTYRLAPWADVLYAADGHWWKHHKAAHDFAGLKVSLLGQRVPNVIALKNCGVDGLEDHPSGVRNGRNSGYQAINVAVHLGARTIVLLGYDMQDPKGKAHWFGPHPTGIKTTDPNTYIDWREHYRSLVKPLAERGISIVNCSRETALTCFPRALLESVLSCPQAVAS